MREPAHGSSVPRGALLGAGALIGLSLLMVAAVRLGVVELLVEPEAAVSERLVLQFEDGADGSVAVLDVEEDEVLAVLEPGEGGFARGVLRALVRERRQHDIGAATPFALVRFADDRLSLEDPSTGRRIDLGAFGPTNAAVFARFMRAGDAEG